MLRNLGLARRASYGAVSTLAIVLATQPLHAQAPQSAEPVTDSGAVGDAEAASEAPPATEQTYGGDIVVTAQRREQRLSEVPVSIQAQTGTALTQAAVTGTRMLEQVSPSLTFNSSFSSTATSFAVRGVQSITAEGGIQPSVGVVIDDMPVARQSEAVLDFADIDRIEILSGPQGTLFGKNATAGVINIITNKPTFQYGGNFELTGTTDKQVIARATINVPLGETLAVRVNGFYDYLNPILKNIGGPDQYGQRNWGVQGKLIWKITDDVDLLLGGNYRKFDDTMGIAGILVPNSGALGDLQNAVLGPAIGRGTFLINQNQRNINRGDSQSFTAQLNADLTDRLSLVAIGGYRRWSGVYGPDVDLMPTGLIVGQGYSPNPLNYPFFFVQQPRPATQRYSYYSGEVRLNYSAPGIDAVAGVYYQDFKEKFVNKQAGGFIADGSFLGLPGGTPYFVNNIINATNFDETVAGFADVTVEVVPTVNLFGGLRYTHEKLGLDYDRTDFFAPAALLDPITGILAAPPVNRVTFGRDQAKNSTNNLSGRFGIQWQPRSGLNYYASYNRGYKGPAVDVSQATVGPDSAIVAAEIAEAFEIGAKQQFFDRKVNLDIALFSETIDNIQQTIIPAGTVTTRLVNAGALKSKGVEASLGVRPLSGLEFTSSVAYVDAKYSGDNFVTCGSSATPANCPTGQLNLDGTQAIGVPKWKVVTTGSYEFPLGTDFMLSARASYTWRSAVQYQLAHDPLSQEPSYGILDLSAGISAVDDSWTITAFVKNVTNKAHYGYLFSTDVFIARSYGYFTRDFRRYGGLTLSAKF
jgi:iron complex outermembrane receptor protein